VDLAIVCYPWARGLREEVGSGEPRSRVPPPAATATAATVATVSAVLLFFVAKVAGVAVAEPGELNFCMSALRLMSHLQAQQG
jgi:hypothetical protein